MQPTLSLIAAMDENQLIANAQGIPWRLPRDIAHFRESTHGKWLLLGRRTFEEMRGWFHEGDMPLVLTSQCGWDPDIGRIVSSVPHALALAESAGQTELVCCGGGQAFSAAMPYADELVVTRVHTRIPPGKGDVFFPAWDPAAWREVRTENHARDDEHAHAFTIQWLEKRPR